MFAKKGYTLIEILVALTIVGVLFSVGYANFRSFSQRQAVKDAAKLVLADLRLTQQIALSGQKPEDINCNSPAHSLHGYTFTILSESTYEVRASCSGGNVSSATKTVSLGTGAFFASPFPSPNPILFKVLGQGTNIPDGQNVTIRITQLGTGNQSSITVSSGGQIQ